MSSSNCSEETVLGGFLKVNVNFSFGFKDDTGSSRLLDNTSEVEDDDTGLNGVKTM